MGRGWWVVGLALATLNCSSSSSEVRALMRDPVAPASDALFNAVIYTNGQLAASPQTDEQWGRLRTHAESLQSAGGRMMAFAPPDRQEAWQRQAMALIQASAEARTAIDNRSLEGVLDTGGKIYATCTGCHAAYMERAD
jgi:hypothetical protein